jgi:tetratricopeptide (TPR) repeat protein
MLLKHGDSTAINLKRAGIGYCNNMQPAKAIPFLLKSYQRDSSDYETCSYLGQSYYNLKDMQKSIYYYKRTLKILSPIYQQTGLTYVLLAESQKGAEKYEDALASYLKAQELKVDPNIYLIIANLYDEQMGNKVSAIKYYQLFLNTFTKLSKTTFTAEYVESVKKRVEFLKEEQKKQAAK